jgi:hypothetical protein
MKKLVSTLKYEISGFALFEDRRFEKASCERYLFLNTDYLNLHFNLSINKDLIKLTPTSTTEEKFIEIFELQTFLTIEEYDILLFELIEKVNSFDQMNILIIALLKHKNYTKKLINYFIDKSLNDITIRRSFEVQKHLLSIITENKELINPILFHRVLSEFPHQSGGLGWVESGKI